MTKARSTRQASLPGMGGDEPHPPGPAEAAPPEMALSTPQVAAAPASEPSANALQALSEQVSSQTAPSPGAMPDLKGKRVWAIDANSLIFQVFHAIPQMTSPKG